MLRQNGVLKHHFSTNGTLILLSLMEDIKIKMEFYGDRTTLRMACVSAAFERTEMGFEASLQRQKENQCSAPSLISSVPSD